jgi:hypothetical protein
MPKAKKKTKAPEKNPDDARRERRANAAHARALEGYHGWDNYETWCVHLWICDDPRTYDAARILARPGTEHEAAERLKDYVNECLVPDLGPSFASKLLGAALSEVNWMEVALAFREE